MKESGATPCRDKSVLLDVKGLKKYFPIQQGVSAQDRRRGEGGGRRDLLPQSGRDAVARRRERLRQDHDRPLHPARHCADGRPGLFLSDNGEVVDVATVPKSRLRPLRRQMQMIFQDPFSSLNPRMTLLDIVGEPLLVHGVGSAQSEPTGWWSCSASWACGRSTCGATPMRSAAASASASASPAPWP